MGACLKLPQKRKLIFEYYYHSDGCKAVNAEAPDCTCWHAEGSGPRPNERHDSETPIVNWRIAPANTQIQRAP